VGALFLAFLVVVLVAVGVFAYALVNKGRRQAAKALGSGLAPNVPPEWAGAHSPEAKLHRRLVVAARMLSDQPLGDAAQIEERVAIEQRLRQLDEQLVAAAAVPRPERDGLVARIEPLVTEAEAAVARLATGRLDLDQFERDRKDLD
jgi:hypothetical protein